MKIIVDKGHQNLTIPVSFVDIGCGIGETGSLFILYQVCQEYFEAVYF